jgi:hypothetical protein
MVEKDLLIDKEKGGRKPMKKKYSTLLNFALAACVATSLAACSGDDSVSTSITGPGHNEINAPKLAMLQGAVKDTNGNPLPGATACTQGKCATTNASGMYTLTDLLVTTTTSVDQGGDDGICIQVHVEPPDANHLNGWVYYCPQAEIDSMQDALEDDNLVEGSKTITNPLVTFIDGYIAEASDAILPALDSTVQGRLENCNTGEALVGVDIRLDLVGIDPDCDEYGSYCGFSTGEYVATTGNDGLFLIPDVPDDSMLRMSIPKYKNIGIEHDQNGATGCYPDECSEEEAYISTLDEGLLYLGDVCAVPITTGDDQSPCIISVGNLIFSEVFTPLDDGHGRLNDETNGTQGIDIVFTETMNWDTVDSNSIVIFDETAEDYITGFTVSHSGNTLTITTAAPIGDDHYINIFLLKGDFEDLGGNQVTIDKFSDADACDDPGFVDPFQSENGTIYVQIDLKLHSPDDTDVSAVTGLVQECVDPLYTKDVTNQSDLQGEYPTVFRSEIKTTNEFKNLNKDASYETRLEGLADLLACPEGTNADAEITNGYATISFTVPSTGTWAVTESNGDLNLDCVDTPSSVGDCDGSGDGKSYTAVIQNAKIGDKVCVDSYDDFDNLGGQECVTLGDCVAPTTVLNYAYNTCGYITNNGTPYFDNNAGMECVDTEVETLFDFGDGGENAGIGEEGKCGVPTLNITCRLLKDPDDAAEGLVSNPIEIFGLYAGDDTPAPGTPEAGGLQLYDATEFAAWVPFSDTIGVAFSESITMTTGGSIAWDGMADITSWQVANDVTHTDDNNTPDGGNGNNADLVLITVDDVLTLANVDHRKIMNFSDAVEDTSGNKADKAQVVINDLMPPFVEYAYWNGGLTIKFNETVAPCIDGETTLSGFNCRGGSANIALWNTGIGGCSGGHDIISLDDATLSDIDGGTDNLLVIPADNLAAVGVSGECNFPSTSDTTYALVYDEDTYDDLNFTGPYGHGAISFGEIPDARGNTWNDYNNHGSWDMWADNDGYGTALCTPPAFAVADVLGPFTVTGIGVTSFADGQPADCSTAGTTGTMTNNVNHVMTYSFSHPLNLEKTFWSVVDGANFTCSGTDAFCTLAEINAGMSDGDWVEAHVLYNTSGLGTGIIGDQTYLTGGPAVLAPDRMSMNITIVNHDSSCYTWANDDILNPDWVVWSAFNVGTGKDLNLQVAP